MVSTVVFDVIGKISALIPMDNTMSMGVISLLEKTAGEALSFRHIRDEEVDEATQELLLPIDYDLHAFIQSREMM